MKVNLPRRNNIEARWKNIPMEGGWGVVKPAAKNALAGEGNFNELELLHRPTVQAST